MPSCTVVALRETHERAGVDRRYLPGESDIIDGLFDLAVVTAHLRHELAASGVDIMDARPSDE